MGWTCFSDSHVLCKTGCWQDVKKCKELVKTCCLEKNTFEDCLYFKRVHPCSFFFSMTLGFAKSTAKKVYRFPVLYGRSGGPFKEKLWSGCRTPKWSVTGVMTFWLWNFYIRGTSWIAVLWKVVITLFFVINWPISRIIQMQIMLSLAWTR